MEEKIKYPYAAVGSFCVYAGADPENGQTLILVLERGARFKGTATEGYGVPGGYLNLSDGEQPRDGAAREMAEEVLTDEGKPVITSITGDRLELKDSGVDYSKGKAGTQFKGVCWHGHVCTLTAGEMTKLKLHIKKMKEDPDYADKVRIASNQETENLHLLTPADLIHKIKTGVIRFAYEHEQQTVVKVAQSLAGPAPGSGLKTSFTK